MSTSQILNLATILHTSVSKSRCPIRIPGFRRGGDDATGQPRLVSFPGPRETALLASPAVKRHQLWPVQGCRGDSEEQVGAVPAAVTRKPHAPDGTVTRCREPAFPGRPRAVPASSPSHPPTSSPRHPRIVPLQRPHASLGGEFSGAFPNWQQTVPTENDLHMFHVRL